MTRILTYFRGIYFYLLDSEYEKIAYFSQCVIIAEVRASVLDCNAFQKGETNMMGAKFSRSLHNWQLH